MPAHAVKGCGRHWHQHQIARIGGNRRQHPDHHDHEGEDRPGRDGRQLAHQRGDQTRFLSQKGLRLAGAWVAGPLDLEGCRRPRDIGLLDCRFEAVPILRSALADTLSLDGSHLPGFAADRLEARGDLLFRSATIENQVSIRLRGADRGNLNSDGAILNSPGDRALGAERISVRGGALMRGATVRGSVAFPGARIGGDLDLTGSVLEETDGRALETDLVIVEGDLALRLAEVTTALAFLIAHLAARRLRLCLTSLEATQSPKSSH